MNQDDLQIQLNKPLMQAKVFNLLAEKSQKNSVLGWFGVSGLILLTYGLIILFFYVFILLARQNFQTYLIVIWCVFGLYWIIIIVAWSKGIHKREELARKMIEDKNREQAEQDQMQEDNE